MIFSMRIIICFHCQQAAEKLLKAFLVVKGQEYPYTHDLFLLLEKILPLNSEAGSLRDPLSILMPYAVEIRYPDYGFSPTAADAKEAREATGKVLEWMLKVIPELF
jgi:HEPN domain-containing protein